jgi:hypothetical protein
MNVKVNVRHSRKGRPLNHFTVHAAGCSHLKTTRRRSENWQSTTLDCVVKLSDQVLFAVCTQWPGAAPVFPVVPQVSEAEGHRLIRQCFEVSIPAAVTTHL